MKKWISVLLMFFLGLSLTGCSTMPSSKNSFQASVNEAPPSPLMQKTKPEKIRMAELLSTQWFVNDVKQEDFG